MIDLVIALLIVLTTTVQGTATWYGTGPGRGHAAAGSELRTGDWRGRHVTVWHGGRHVQVILDDWCACKGSRIIDLSDEDFDTLADLSDGVIPVRVTSGWTDQRPIPIAPATDVGLDE